MSCLFGVNTGMSYTSESPLGKGIMYMYVQCICILLKLPKKITQLLLVCWFCEMIIHYNFFKEFKFGGQRMKTGFN